MESMEKKLKAMVTRAANSYSDNFGNRASFERGSELIIPLLLDALRALEEYEPIVKGKATCMDLRLEYYESEITGDTARNVVGHIGTEVDNYLK